MAENKDLRKTLEEENLTLTDLAVWPHEAVLLLLEKYRSKRHLLKIPNIKRMSVWELIAKEINEEGYSFTAQVCLKKWDNMRNRYRIIAERHKSQGKAGTRWAYWGVMADILQDDISTTVPVISSSLCGARVNTTSKTEESEDEHDPLPTVHWSFPETGSRDHYLASSRTEGTQCKAKKRKREEPPAWLKEFTQKTTQALDRITETVEERNALLRKLLEKL